jgi:Ca2+/H+ antiporter, TMEM165/GDT1 family
MIDSFERFTFALGSSFSLIALAEVGDKSQLVCMALAARYRAMPVLSAAIIAFALLNIIAVAFGAAFARWLPEDVVLLIVATLFIAFGVHFLRQPVGEEDDLAVEKSAHNLFISTLLLIMVAEFGDKTQLAVAGLSSMSNPLAVWLGATLALALTSALGVVAGRTIMQHISINLLHRISGGLFIVLGLLALLRLLYKG